MTDNITLILEWKNFCFQRPYFWRDNYLNIENGDVF